jgi:PRTRC genetic system protein E
VQLMPLLADRTLMIIVSKADDQHLTLSVVPKRMKESENAALTTPLCCTGTPEELDHNLPTQLRDFVAGHVTLSNNLAQIQREREEAEKAAREELKKKQRTVGNGGAKGKAPDVKPPEEEKAAPPAPQSSMMSLFDSPADGEALRVPESSLTASDRSTSVSIASGNNDNNNTQEETDEIHPYAP